MSRRVLTLVAVLAAAGCSPGNECKLVAHLEQGDQGSTIRYYDLNGTLLATCAIPAVALGPCDSTAATCLDPAGNAVPLCSFNGCFVAPP